MTLSVLVSVPALHLARFDVFAGRHFSLGAPAGGVAAFATLFIAIAAFYAVTFLVNAIAGRLFCGWGCPVGHLSRLGDFARAARPGRPRLRAWGELLGFSAVFSAAVLSWWASPSAIFAAGVALAAAWGIATAVGLIHARWISWSFCKQACPIGLYYTVVQRERSIAVVHDPAPCTDCAACERVCPVELDPRAPETKIEDRGGLSIDGMPSANHCLRCGDCVETCELVSLPSKRRVSLRFGIPSR